MKIEIINLYNDIAPKDGELIANHGQAFLIRSKENQTLFDTGQIGKYLLHNMNKLNVDPNEINTVVISHGHTDHSGGLNDLIKARTIDEKLTVIFHPIALLPKGGYKTKEKKKIRDASFPLIPDELKEKINLCLVKEPYKITDYLATTGEILQRPHKDGTSDNHVFFEDGKWKPDKMIDDINLVVQTKDGLVIICGCCHAGLLNTLEQVTKQYPNQTINAILGGTHMVRYTGAEVDYVAKGLSEKYSKPKLYFNHCSGKNVIDQLLDSFGSDIIEDCLIGKKLVYEY